jgi:adenosylcobyric acid synthase
MDRTGRIIGSYVHGIFREDRFRRHFLARLGATTDTTLDFDGTVDQALDSLAAHLARHVDIDRISRIAGLERIPGN